MVGSGRGARGRGGRGSRRGLHASTDHTPIDTRQGNGQWKNLIARQGFTHQSFSLSEEARNTERHHSWHSDLKLRHSRVAFISAGTSTAEDLNPIIQKSENSDEATESFLQEKCRAPAMAFENPSTTHALTPDGQMSKMTLGDLKSTPIAETKLEEGLDSMFEQRSVQLGHKPAEASSEVFFTDLTGADEPVHTGCVPPKMKRSPSLTDSDSSGEVIIFTGRRQSSQKSDQKHTSDARSGDLKGQENKYSLMATVIDDPIRLKKEETDNPPVQRRPSFSPLDSERVLGHLNDDLRATATKNSRRKRRTHVRKETTDEVILHDYLANVCNGSDLEAFLESSMLNQRDLGGSDTAEWQDELESLTTGRVEREPLMDSEVWDSIDLMDFDELSTSDEALESIEHVLSKRERPSGVQYLVIGAGHTADDARWFPLCSLKIAGAEALIQEFEDNAESNRILNSGDVSDASLTVDEKAAQDVLEDLDDQEDEKDLEETRKARMTDEQIARLLSKQEELGLGSNDLMLFDGDDGTDSEMEVQLDELWERAGTHQAPSRSKRAKQSQSKLASATAFADILDQDPYNGFDIMDQQRPSLRKRPKGRRGKLSMELSDSELEQSIHTAWEKDRTKKKMRKQEREELRAQGLLGKKNRVDMTAKYSGGISMTDVKKEIREFLLSSMERYVP